jgi:Zn-dependent protease/predicted transcriptional regulator
MRSGFSIGRVFGVNIRIDWSWLLIFLLITWNLGTTFGELHPGWGMTLRWGMAVGAALLFFASVLAHELAHSLVAKARGVPVRSITLHLFGGVSNIEREPDSPGGEFVMAILGPVTSLVIGGVLVWIAGLGIGPLGEALADPTKAIGQINPALTLLMWLGSVNIMVGLFNLIPGFPLDGGRVLRSILWAMTDNLRQATRWASWVGQGIAWLMIFAGIAMTFGVQIPVLGTGLGNGLWLAFIGWFLNNASAQSYQKIVVQDILEDVPVARMMRSDPPTLSSDISVSSMVHDHVMGTDECCFPVLDDGRIVGIVTLDDVRAVSRDAWDTRTIRQIMTPADQLVTVAPDEDAAEALHKLMRRDVRQLPVLRDGKLAGVLRRRDIIRWLQLHSELGAGPKLERSPLRSQ